MATDLQRQPTAENAIVRDRNGLQSFLSQGEMVEKIRDVISSHLTPERLVRMAMIAASRQPRLYECTRASIAQAVIQAGQLGLDCSGTLGSGYLVPFRNNKIGAYEVIFIAGYRGLIDLARRGGQISKIEAHVVYESDSFSIAFGLEPKLDHVPDMSGKNRGKMKCAYAVALLKDGSKQSEVMTIDEVNAIRQRSRASDSGPWVTDYAEMARKTVIRRLCKYLPLSAEMEEALATETAAEFETIDAEAISSEMIDQGNRGTEALAKKIAARKQKPTPTETPAEPQPEEPKPIPASGGPSPLERIAITVSEYAECSEALAMRKIAEFAQRLYGVAPDALTEKQVSELAGHAQRKAIK